MAKKTYLMVIAHIVQDAIRQDIPPGRRSCQAQESKGCDLKNIYADHSNKSTVDYNKIEDEIVNEVNSTESVENDEAEFTSELSATDVLQDHLPTDLVIQWDKEKSKRKSTHYIQQIV